MAVVQYALLAGCCGGTSQCCSDIVGVWYLCLAIIVLAILISCSDLLKSRCYFIGLPWSQSKLRFVNGIDNDEIHLLQDQQDLDGMGYHCQAHSLKLPPPPPYSTGCTTDEMPNVHLI